MHDILLPSLLANANFHSSGGHPLHYLAHQRLAERTQSKKKGFSLISREKEGRQRTST